MPVTYFRSPQHKYKVACAPPPRPEPTPTLKEVLVPLPEEDKPWVLVRSASEPRRRELAELVGGGVVHAA